MLGNGLGFIMSTNVVRGPEKAYGTKKYPTDWASSTYNQSTEAILEVRNQILFTNVGLTILSGITVRLFKIQKFSYFWL